MFVHIQIAQHCRIYTNTDNTDISEKKRMILHNWLENQIKFDFSQRGKMNNQDRIIRQPIKKWWNHGCKCNTHKS